MVKRNGHYSRSLFHSPFCITGKKYFDVISETAQKTIENDWVLIVRGLWVQGREKKKKKCFKGNLHTDET